ncbi:MAG: phage tail assembly chaperone [Janthinobacterium lividum]
MNSLTIGEHEFSIGRMPVRKQFHVARRLAPLMSSMVGQLDALRSAPAPLAETGADKLDSILSRLKIAPIADALADMNDADCDYILDACLDVVSIKQGERMFPLMRGGRMMFDFITMPQMLQIAAEVVKQDLAGFMTGGGSASPGLSAA